MIYLVVVLSAFASLTLTLIIFNFNSLPLWGCFLLTWIPGTLAGAALEAKQKAISQRHLSGIARIAGVFFALSLLAPGFIPYLVSVAEKSRVEKNGRIGLSVKV